MARTKSWNEKTDPLFRGCDGASPGTPVPAASPSLVRHILYLEGYGRETPYLSSSEELEWARHFAGGRDDALWKTEVPRARSQGVKHRGRKELVGLLKGKGKGDASWPSAYEVMRARAYVEEKLEHLLDFRDVPAESAGEVASSIFEKV